MDLRQVIFLRSRTLTFISNNAKNAFISFNGHSQLFVTLGVEMTFSKSSSILYFHVFRENDTVKYLARLVWMQVTVRAVPSVSAESPISDFPPRAFGLG